MSERREALYCGVGGGGVSEVGGRSEFRIGESFEAGKRVEGIVGRMVMVKWSLEKSFDDLSEQYA